MRQADSSDAFICVCEYMPAAQTAGSGGADAGRTPRAPPRSARAAVLRLCLWCSRTGSLALAQTWAPCARRLCTDQTVLHV